MTTTHFSEFRNVELSTIKYIESNINTDWTGITTVKSFTLAYEANLPVIAVYGSDIYPDYKEIGSTTLLNKYQINIDIFAKSDGQRIDLTGYITELLKDPWIYYLASHSSGNTSMIYTDSTKKIRVQDFITNTKVDFGDDVDTYDKFRQKIVVNVLKL